MNTSETVFFDTLHIPRMISKYRISSYPLLLFSYVSARQPSRFVGVVYRVITVPRSIARVASNDDDDDDDEDDGGMSQRANGSRG